MNNNGYKEVDGNETEIGTIFNSLKNRCDKFAHYFPLYERHFSKFKGKAPKILEIGVQYGGSAELWKRYFGSGTTIHGVDIAPACTSNEYLTVHVGDQGNSEFWRSEFGSEIERFDLIIDDGSHDNPDQITTLISTFAMLKRNGVYWCEDTHTSYYHRIRVRDGGLGNPNSFVAFTRNLVDMMHAEHTRYAIGHGEFEGPTIPGHLLDRFSGVVSVHYYDSIVAIEKGYPTGLQRMLHTP